MQVNCASGPVLARLGCLDVSDVPEPLAASLATASAGPIRFTARTILTGMTYSYGFAVADFNRDGRPDISFFDSYTGNSSRTPAGVIGYVQYNGGSLTTIVDNDPMPELPFTGVLLLERQVAVDVNGDSYLDIVGVLNSHEHVMAYINPGPAGGKWARRTLASGLPNPINIASGDIDGDGDPDIAINMRVNSDSSDSEPRGIVWLENPGSGNAAWTTRRITQDSYSRSLVLADIDGNGILDVVASDNQSGAVTAFIGNGGRMERASAFEQRHSRPFRLRSGHRRRRAGRDFSAQIPCDRYAFSRSGHRRSGHPIACAVRTGRRQSDRHLRKAG